MKTCVIMQPTYLPWLGYLKRIAESDVFVFLDIVQFEKNSYTNRNRIKTASGPCWLTIPVLQQGHIDRKLLATEIDTRQDWRKKHLASLKDYEGIFIFGSGGKGINFAYAAVKNDINIIAALDDQEKIWGKYLDTSGVEVMSPQDSRICEARGLLVVMNHNHLESARRRFSDNLQVESLMTL